MTSRKILGASLVLGILLLIFVTGYGFYTLGMTRGMNMGGDVVAGSEPNLPAQAASSPAQSPAAGTAAIPQSIAEGEAATRRHIAAGIKAGEADPANGNQRDHHKAYAQNFSGCHGLSFKETGLDCMSVWALSGAR